MFTIGADPEGFLVDKAGIPVSSIGKIGGTKANPLPVPGGALQEDNVLIEFNIDPVLLLFTSDKKYKAGEDSFVRGISTMKQAAQAAADKHGLSVVYTTEKEYPAQELLHKKAMASGCDPDLNVYTRKENDYPPLEGPWRGAGGHIHIGNEDIHSGPESMCQLMYWLDLMVGSGCKIVEGHSKREGTYGKFGNYRNKPYGVEYRTPSGLWVQEEGTTRMVYRLTAIAAEKWSMGMAISGDKLAKRNMSDRNNSIINYQNRRDPRLYSSMLNALSANDMRELNKIPGVTEVLCT